MAKLKKAAAVLALVGLLLPVTGQAVETESTDDGNILVGVYDMDMLPGNWSPLSEMTEEKEFLLNMTSDRLYHVGADGEIIPSMASSMPVDVTAQYAGNSQYGVPAEAVRGYAFQIDLNEIACWEEGTPVTADDWLFSVKQYWNDGKSYVNLYDEGSVSLIGEEDAQRVVSLKEAGFTTVIEAREAGFTDFFVDVSRFWGLSGGWKSVEDRTRLRDYAIPSGLNEFFVSPAYLYETYLAEDRMYERWQGEMVGVCPESGAEPATRNLGLVKTGDHQITLILSEPTTVTALALDLGQYRPLPEAIWSESYGTPASGYWACGPYRVESADMEQIVLVRNENWYGKMDSQQPQQIRCRPVP